MNDGLEASEAQLIERARQGDTDAFAALVRLHERYVYNLAFRTLNNADEAADMAQEAFVRAWLALPTFRQQARLRTWLYRIVLNLCLNRLPRLRREIHDLTQDELGDSAEPVSPTRTPAHHAEVSEEHIRVHREIDRLPAQYRLLISLRYQDELSYEEISHLLGVPVGTVKTGLFRAKARLRDALSAHMEELP
jgi:RNA polymerase sigma-70 factor (ECF subfamily)